MYDQAGTEIFTLELARELVKQGHKVTLYSCFFSKYFQNQLTSLAIPIANNLESISKEKFSLAHVHHNINAVEIRYYFPKLPIVFLSHGIISFLDQPPLLDLKISQYMAISEEVRASLIKAKIAKKQIALVHNIFNRKLFRPKKPINQRPQKVLVISNRLTAAKIKVINQSTGYLGLKVTFVGKPHNPVSNNRLSDYINKSDLVLTLGRGAVETMLCGRIPIISGNRVGDGMVTPQNFRLLMKKNFSGRSFFLDFDKQTLIKEIKKYKPENGNALRQLTCQYFDTYSVLRIINHLYKVAATAKPKTFLTPKANKLLSFYVKSCQQTRQASYHYHPLLQSRFYQFWQRAHQILDKLKPGNDNFI